MNEVLVTAGVVCMIAAVVGGGLKAFGTDVPVISSLPRQLLLFFLGLALVVFAWLVKDDDGSGGNGGDGSDAYRTSVAAACQRIVEIRSAEVPIDAIEVTPEGIKFRKVPIVAELRRRGTAIGAELDAVFALDAPEDLDDDVAGARATSQEWRARLDDALTQIESLPLELLTQADIEPFTQPGDAELRARLNSQMSSLAGDNCPVSA
jgi:hypothetical protein